MAKTLKKPKFYYPVDLSKPIKLPKHVRIMHIPAANPREERIDHVHRRS